MLLEGMEGARGMEGKPSLHVSAGRHAGKPCGKHEGKAESRRIMSMSQMCVLT